MSGGHTTPTFFVLAALAGGGDHLYKTTGSPISPDLTTWSELNVQGGVLQPKPWPDSGILDGSQTYGPVFPNPFNPAEVYVLTSTGVRVSEVGGLSFQTDTELTNLITANGKYPLTGQFAGGNSLGVRIDCDAIYVGTEGGGIYRITGYEGIR
jgi:hypothetical protein